MHFEAVICMSPCEPFDDALHTLFKVERAEMDAGNVGLFRQSTNHLDGNSDAIVLDFLVIMLVGCRSEPEGHAL